MGRPKGSTNKTNKSKQSTVSVLAAALDFVGCAVTENTDTPWKGCVQFNEGQIIAYNSILTAGCKVEEEFACCPDYELLKRALDRSTGAVAFTQLDSSKLAVSSGKFRAVIPCVDPLIMPDVAPDPNIAPADDILRTGFELIGPIVKENGHTVVEASLLLTGGSMVACDRHLMVEFYHGVSLPPDLVLPKVFVQAIIGTKKKIVGFGYSPGNSITFWFNDNSWIKTQLFNSPWPNWQSMLNKGNSARCVEIPEEFFTAIEHVLPFSTDGAVYFNGDTCTSHTTLGQGASYEFASPKGFAYSGSKLLLLKGRASVIEFSSDNKVAFFFANVPPIRGALVQRTGIVRPTDPVSETPTPAQFQQPVQQPPQEAQGAPLPDTASDPTPSDWQPPVAPAPAPAPTSWGSEDTDDEPEGIATEPAPWTTNAKVPFPG